MNLSIAHLGPPGNHSEQAALYYANWLARTTGIKAILCPHPSIAQSLKAVAEGKTKLAVVPAENSIEGSVTMTMDAMWQLDTLQIQLALNMPIVHVLISCAENLEQIQTVYSHPQGLAQCQVWLEKFLPNVQLIATNSTTSALPTLEQDTTAAAISSHRAAQLYNLPILADGINDYPDNCTRFWVVSQNATPPIIDSSKINPTHTSLAFSVPANVPGALVKNLKIFANLNLNLSRIESRPTKRSLGEYLFFIDIESGSINEPMESAFTELASNTEILKIFGSYGVLSSNNL
ncbi:prephenate dehydratase [Calothrix sp. PCC 6303]|uniref:prephenate dehydratase n=1 Tax=Calothrix sp. PCC 6303 TaxID=1170562 RepID=UPI0002A04D4E|nr:prephenate dehydratase [Calothrix sp. PCC 6303]AFZ00562.1 prephenate dehydratase [Calothrix sp. PCC 6303]